MNAMIPAGMGNKENSPPNSGAITAAKTGRTSKHTQKRKHLCPNYKKMVTHKGKLYYELEANKDKRYNVWVSSPTLVA
jgi:hypothetical protein